MPANDDSRGDAFRSDQLAELRSDVRHLQSDVTDIKADFETEIRTINQKIDVLRDKIEGLGKSLGSAKLWAVLLISAVVVQLLYVVAHGLKWL